MTRKKTDAPVTPIRPQAPITAAELRQARDGFLAAEGEALDALSRILKECETAPPGISAWASTFSLDAERGDLARKLLTHLEPVLGHHARTA